MTDEASNEMTGGQCFGQNVSFAPPGAKAILIDKRTPVMMAAEDLVFILGHLGSEKGNLSVRPGGAFTALKAMDLRQRLEAALGDLT
jgi:hypothetical protein